MNSKTTIPAHTTINPAIGQSVTGHELVKAKSAIEQFLYSCSHTLRSPLKSIAGLVYLLKNTGDNPDHDPRLFLDSIEKTVHRMEAVLNELETFLSNSRQLIATQPIDVTSLLSELRQEHESYLTAHEIQMQVSIDQPVPFYSDKSRVRMMLSHVLANAIHFSDPAKENREVRVAISVCGDCASIEIADNGIGIGEGVLPQVFDLFYRGSEQSRGSGVGLYIVREAAEKLGATLRLASEPGTGTTCSMTIPNLQP